MKQIEVYVVRFLEWVSDALIDIPYYIIFFMLSLYTIEILLNIFASSKYVSSFGSTPIILIFFTILFIIYWSVYKYLNFVKFTINKLIWFVSITVIFIVAMRALSWLCGHGLGESVLELLEQIHSVLEVVTLFAIIGDCLIFTSLLQHAGEHSITAHFKSTCVAINNLGKSQNNEMSTYKNMHEIYRASNGYKSGIKHIKNLLMRGIDLDGFFNLNAGLCLNEILDWLTFSMQYYLFYGGHEQMEAVKNHIEHIVGTFDDNYHINSNQFMHETLRMYNEMNVYFTENDIDIVYNVKFTDRIKGYFPQAIVLIALLAISRIIKYFILN